MTRTTTEAECSRNRPRCGFVRGHRLVADDTVEIRRRQETILIGTCPELTRHHMELGEQQRPRGIQRQKALQEVNGLRQKRKSPEQCRGVVSYVIILPGPC